MSDMYCVKCKRKTNTNNISNNVSKNGKNMLQGTCDICGTKKTKFVSNSQSGGMLNKGKIRTMELKPYEYDRLNLTKPYKALM